MKQLPTSGDAQNRLTAKSVIVQAASRVARRDAETLLLHVLGRDRAWLLAHPDALLTAAQDATFDALITRRAAREPLQYLTGYQEFYGLDLHVSPAVLIPRPETELLVEAVLDWAQEPVPASLHLVDVGTGSGAIALALATHLASAEITALDLSLEALAVAQANAQRLGLAKRVRFLHSDLLDAVPPNLTSGHRVDAIVSNPPYVPQKDKPTLQPEVRDFEPHGALFAGDDGLAIYQRLIPEAFALLRPRGLLAMEFGFGQKADLATLLHSWENVRFLDDLAGIPRVVLATRP
ncbi:MAG: peptide chain release factor N(5)-glutamine methyltransferase [Janthinobacterium lividum]